MDWLVNQKIESDKIPARRQEIIQAVLKNRGLTTPSLIHDFLHSKNPLTLTPHDIGLDLTNLHQSLDRIERAIKLQEPIIIYGDYDADGITATAILWETLSYLKAKAYPFIPSREAHGYGLSIKGLTAAFTLYQPLGINPKTLIITVDNGITAYEASDFLRERGLDLIITDHHQRGSHLPPHLALVHTTKVSGAGIAWFLAKELVHMNLRGCLEGKRQVTSEVDLDLIKDLPSQTLDLVTIGTVADMLPLTGVNRSLVKFGLDSLRHTQRLGLQALYKEAGLEPGIELTTYHLNYLIAPRLNAMGRLEHAIDSLRLLCTKNPKRADTLAHYLGQTNVTRQDLTQTLVDKALSLVADSTESILVVDNPDFHEGVIGLVAGKLTETYYRPAIVISRGEPNSKGSARSISGVNIIAMIREHEALLINAGGHPMAAGFSLKTENIALFREAILNSALAIDPTVLKPKLVIDCLLHQSDVSDAFYREIQTLKPFGPGNPEPVFALTHVPVLESRPVGKKHQHLKLTLKTPTGMPLNAIGFNLADKFNNLGNILPGGVPEVSPALDLAFTLSQNTWNGRTTLQLILKDIKISQLLPSAT